jgi:hypothetical protein
MQPTLFPIGSLAGLMIPIGELFTFNMFLKTVKRLFEGVFGEIRNFLRDSQIWIVGLQEPIGVKF